MLSNLTRNTEKSSPDISLDVNDVSAYIDWIMVSSKMVSNKLNLTTIRPIDSKYSLGNSSIKDYPLHLPTKESIHLFISRELSYFLVEDINTVDYEQMEESISALILAVLIKNIIQPEEK